MVIEHNNIIYMSDIPELGGTSTFVYEMVKKYHNLDIAVVCKSCHIAQEERIRKYCDLYRLQKNDIIKAKVTIINYDTSELDQIEKRPGDKIYMVFHADYSHNAYKTFPKFDNRIDGYISITRYIQQKMKEKFGIDSIVCYNPLTVEKSKRIVLVSATRLSPIKGKDRMIKLAEELTRQRIDFIWYIFTNDLHEIGNSNVVYMKPRLDVWKWIQEADFVVQLSDTEALSYTINEALYRNVPVIVTPLPYLEEIGVKDNENALILHFNCDNVKEVASRIKNKIKMNYEPLQDRYNEILAKGSSHYKEMKSGMKKIRVKQKFRDMKHGNILRTPGFEFIEEDARANDLIDRGFVTLIEDIKLEVEHAVKEVKKEKAIKEKAVKKVAAKK